MQLVKRSDWGAAPPKPPGLTPWNITGLDGICQHWFGSPKAADGHAGCDNLLRSVQASHQAGEYVDIAYNIGVCPHGEAYELRGWNNKTGANGTSDANSRFLAVVYMAGVGDGLTDKGKATLRAVYAEAFDRGVSVRMRRHGEFVGTSCPGPAVTAWLETGAWRPKPKVRFVLMDGEGNELARSAAVEATWEQEKAKLADFLLDRQGMILRELRDDGDAAVRRVKA